jgi:NADPH:quinone reductase-like Zn-dependent oxidoreductase
LGSGLLTAAVALFGTLRFPLVKVADLDDYSPESPWILVWGGAGITGVYLIQLARLLGFRVVCAASPINHEYVRSLGAEVVLDRWAHEESLVAEIHEVTQSNVSGIGNHGSR